MPALTPEQEALKQAALTSNEGPWTSPQFSALATPTAILALFAQLDGCNEDYGCAVNSVAQLQDEVLEVRAQLEAAQEAASEPEECRTCKGGDNCRFPLCRDADEQQQIADEVAVDLLGVPAQTGTALQQPVQAVPEHIKYRWNIERQTDGSLLICENGHEKGEKCEYVRYVPSTQQLVQAVPDALLDGMAVYEEVQRKAGHMRTSPENVSDTLDAVVRLIRTAPGDPAQ